MSYRRSLSLQTRRSGAAAPSSMSRSANRRSIRSASRHPSTSARPALRTFSVTAIDRAGQPVTDDIGTIQFVSPTDRSAKFLTRTYTFTTADHGTHEFPGGVTFHKGGAEVVKVEQLNNTRISGTQAFGIE